MSGTARRHSLAAILACAVLLCVTAVLVLDGGTRAAKTDAGIPAIGAPFQRTTMNGETRASAKLARLAAAHTALALRSRSAATLLS